MALTGFHGSLGPRAVTEAVTRGRRHWLEADVDEVFSHRAIVVVTAPSLRLVLAHADM